MDNAANTVVGFAIVVKQSGEVFLPNTVFIGCITRRILIDVENSGLDIAVRTVTEIIFVTVKFNPFVAQPFTCPAIMCSFGVLDKIAAYKFVFTENVIISIYGLISSDSLEGLRTEIVIIFFSVFVREVPPTGSGDTVDGVVGGAVKLNKAGDFALAGAGRFVEAIEILVAFIVNTGNFVNALQGIVFGEVIRNTVYGFPTGPGAIVKNETVGEFLIRLTVEVAALGMNGVFRFLIGVNAVLLLERGLAGHVIERICAEINVIAHGTGVSNGQSLVCAPRCAVLNGELHAAENANGVSSIGRNCLALLDEVALDGKKIVFINFRRGKREVVVRHRKSVKIYINIRVKLEFYRYFGLAADAFRKLEKQIPCGNAGNIATGNHFKQRLKLFGNFYRHHIQTEDIGDIHRQIGVNYMVTIRDIVVAGNIFRVGNCSCPRKGSAAACCIVEVENSLIFAVHCNFKRSTD